MPEEPEDVVPIGEFLDNTTNQFGVPYFSELPNEESDERTVPQIVDCFNTNITHLSGALAENGSVDRDSRNSSPLVPDWTEEKIAFVAKELHKLTGPAKNDELIEKLKEIPDVHKFQVYNYKCNEDNETLFTDAAIGDSELALEAMLQAQPSSPDVFDDAILYLMKSVFKSDGEEKTVIAVIAENDCQFVLQVALDAMYCDKVKDKTVSAENTISMLTHCYGDNYSAIFMAEKNCAEIDEGDDTHITIVKKALGRSIAHLALSDEKGSKEVSIDIDEIDISIVPNNLRLASEKQVREAFVESDTDDDKTMSDQFIATRREILEQRLRCSIPVRPCPHPMQDSNKRRGVVPAVNER